MVAGPGLILADIDRATRAHSGQELRIHPSTYNTASIGGFIAGGSGGVGSINFGGLRDFGNVLRLRVVTMEAEPRVLELTGEDLHKVTHAYGTNGIITEVEMPLTASYDWVDVIVGFDSFMEAARYGNALACQDGILTKLITPIAAPVPWLYFKRHQKFLKRRPEHLRRDGRAACAGRVPRLHRAAKAARSSSTPRRWRTRRGCRRPSNWPGTTRRLRAIRVDPSITYLQSLYPFPDHLALIEKMARMFPGECFPISSSSASTATSTCLGLPLVRFTTEERLDEIVRLHEENGCPIFNPHRYTLEEGGMKQTDDVQLAFKREADPQGSAQPRQDDRLGKSRLRLSLRQDLPVQAACSGLPRDPPRWRMKVLVLYAHPVETSFNAALHRLILERLSASGHTVDDCDLYAEGFRSSHEPRRAARLPRRSGQYRRRSTLCRTASRR